MILSNRFINKNPNQYLRVKRVNNQSNNKGERMTDKILGSIIILTVLAVWFFVFVPSVYPHEQKDCTTDSAIHGAITCDSTK